MIKKIILALLVAVFFFVIYRNIFNIKIVEIGNIKVVDSDEKIFFVFEDFFHKELKRFRKRENLDSEAGNLKSEFDTIVALRNWTNKQWEQGNPNPYPPFNANVILELIRSKETGGWCGQYGAVFAQACMSFGIPARYMEIMPEGSGGHFLVEVYSRDYKKWVLMDPTLNVHYEKDGIPLSVVELHNYKNHLKADNVLSSIRFIEKHR
ncbi:MAG: Transglutaminase-like superfamily protein [Elusimicrobia bacterium ADurb.Bin231]|nr:MAG: Transglutaminase-like superfamily protein [Elusimicrobia bacterium ADurb.Bin231]